jgi:hypothetical protein
MKRTRRIRRESLVDVAYHEAGHAVMACILGREVERVSIFHDARNGSSSWISPTGATRGETRLMPHHPRIDLSSPKYKALAEREALVALAGNLAQLKHQGEPHDMHLALSDLDGIGYAAAHVGGSSDRLNAYLDRLALKTRLYLDVFWDKVERVADALLRCRTLSGEELSTLLRQRTEGDLRACSTCRPEGTR